MRVIRPDLAQSNDRYRGHNSRCRLGNCEELIVHAEFSFRLVALIRSSLSLSRADTGTINDVSYDRVNFSPDMEGEALAIMAGAPGFFWLKRNAEAPYLDHLLEQRRAVNDLEAAPPTRPNGKPYHSLLTARTFWQRATLRMETEESKKTPNQDVYQTEESKKTPDQDVYETEESKKTPDQNVYEYWDDDDDDDDDEYFMQDGERFYCVKDVEDVYNALKAFKVGDKVIVENACEGRAKDRNGMAGTVLSHKFQSPWYIVTFGGGIIIPVRSTNLRLAREGSEKVDSEKADPTPRKRPRHAPEVVPTKFYISDFFT
jgi:hypothetical protein